MSYLIAAPEMMAAAATDAAAVGSTLGAAHMAATAPTIAVIPAAADEVSASIAQLFSRYAQDYQALAGKAAAFHEQFVQHLNANAHSYAATEAVSAASLQHLNATATSAAPTILNPPSKILNTLANIWNAVGGVLAPIRPLYNLGYFTYGLINLSIYSTYLFTLVITLLLQTVFHIHLPVL
jgi:hypothetical protein